MHKQTRTLALLAFLFALTFVVPSLAEARSRGYQSSYDDEIRDLDDDKVKKLPIPILFGISLRQITPNYGDDRDGGSRSHEGLDIMAPKGAPIISPTEAVVISTGDGEGSGEYVTTANPGGEFFTYMHLSEISVEEGDELDKGDLIGLVGNTGNASGGAPHLHFEVRDDDHDPEDPYKRIKKELALKDKIKYLKGVMNDVDDEDDVAEFIAKTYQSELRQGVALSYALPKDVLKELNKLPIIVVPTSYATPSGDLTLNSQGPLVVTMQQALIAKNAGPAAKELKTAGATGYFGPVTQRALIEFQAANGIDATGYYGPKTRAVMLGM